jgi:predicted dehydrogenase
MLRVHAEGLDRILRRLPQLTPAGFADAEAVVLEGADASAKALEAARARKHILLAAPLASTLEAADRLLTECANANVRLMAANPARFLPSVQAIKSTLDSGKLGQPGLLRIHRWEPRSTQGAALGTLGAGESGAASGATVWRMAASEIDLARWLFGRLPTELCVIGRDADYLQLHLGFPEGGMALIDCATTLPVGPGYTSRSLIASTGAAYADDHHNMQLVYRGGASSALRTTEGNAGTIAMLREFLDAVTNRREPSCTTAEARDTVLIAEAAARCLAANRTARLTGDRYELN